MAYKFNIFTGRFDIAGNSSGSAPGGSDTDIQFNNSGTFGGTNNLTWDGSTLLIKNGSGNQPVILYNSSGFYALFDLGLLTDSRFFQFPDSSGTLALFSDIKPGSILTTTNDGDDQNYTLSGPPTSSSYYAIINNGSYTTGDINFPFSVTGLTLTFTSPLPSDLANTQIFLVCV